MCITGLRMCVEKCALDLVLSSFTHTNTVQAIAVASTGACFSYRTPYQHPPLALLVLHAAYTYASDGGYNTQKSCALAPSTRTRTRTRTRTYAYRPLWRCRERAPWRALSTLPLRTVLPTWTVHWLSQKFSSMCRLPRSCCGTDRVEIHTSTVSPHLIT